MVRRPEAHKAGWFRFLTSIKMEVSAKKAWNHAREELFEVLRRRQLLRKRAVVHFWTH